MLTYILLSTRSMFWNLCALKYLYFWVMLKIEWMLMIRSCLHGKNHPIQVICLIWVRSQQNGVFYFAKTNHLYENGFIPPTIIHKIFENDSSFHVHYEKSLISVFQKISASINKIFILAGRLGTRLSSYEVSKLSWYFLIS